MASKQQPHQCTGKTMNKQHISSIVIIVQHTRPGQGSLHLGRGYTFCQGVLAFAALFFLKRLRHEAPRMQLDRQRRIRNFKDFVRPMHDVLPHTDSEAACGEIMKLSYIII